MDDGQEEDWAESYETLTTLANNKINLNTATPEDLRQLPFLNETQIEDISQYIYRHAPLRSWGEMAMIASLDAPMRKLLQHFVYIGPAKQQTSRLTLHDILKYGKSELTATASIPFYTRQGDRGAYRGEPYRHSLRYTFSCGQYLKAGFIGAQDAGEPFLNQYNRWGYDYYSFYVNIRKLASIRSLVVGRYRMKLGMGLVLNNDFSFGKLMALSAMSNMNPQIRPHSSKSQANYMQGVAATVRLNNYFDITSFLSWRNIDATLSQDRSTITTILTSGYHRTASELQRKNNASEFAAGSHLSYRHRRVSAGATILYNRFSLPLMPDTKQKFRRYQPQGRTFINTGVNYAYRGRRFSLQGETAFSIPEGDGNNHMALATLNMFSADITSALSLRLLQRFYSYQYTALHARSFSEGGKVQNESGLFIGTNWTPSTRCTLSAYADIAYFPWARYLVSQASHAADAYLAAEVSGKRFTWNAHYRFRVRQGDNADKTTLVNKKEHRARITLQTLCNPFAFKTQIDAALAQASSESRGVMATQYLAWHSKEKRLQLETLFGYFHTDDYDSRLYCYERNMMYNFNFPMYYGHGIHYALWTRIQALHNLTLTARIATAKYFDRSTIASGQQTINRSSQTNLDLQLKWNF